MDGSRGVARCHPARAIPGGSVPSSSLAATRVPSFAAPVFPRLLEWIGWARSHPGRSRLVGAVTDRQAYQDGHGDEVGLMKPPVDPGRRPGWKRIPAGVTDPLIQATNVLVR